MPDRDSNSVIGSAISYVISNTLPGRTGKKADQIEKNFLKILKWEKYRFYYRIN